MILRIYFINFVKILFYLLLIIYFVYHIFSGNYGIYSFIDINNDLIVKQNQLLEAQNNYKKKQDKINRLKTNNLDLDLFEEELKKNTNLVSQDEIVIFINDLDKIK